MWNKIRVGLLAFALSSFPAQVQADNSPFIWEGTFAKNLAQNIDFRGNAYFLTGTVDPTVSAQSAPKGSLYLRYGSSGGTLYTKQDNGSSTNWVGLAGGISGGGSSTDKAIVRWSGTAGSSIQNGISTEDDSGNITATSFIGPVTGNVTGAATQATTVQTSTNASFFPLFVASSTNGNQVFDLGTGLTFNPSTNLLSTTTFSGALTGHASLDLPLTGGTLTGALLFIDNTLDIGASGATRPRTGYFGTSVVSPLFTGALTGTASGNTTYTANNHGAVISGSANTLTVIAPDASTAKVLVSGGASADPGWSLLANANLTGSAAISNANLATMAAHSYKGNNTASTATPLDLTATQLTAELNALVGDSGSGGTKGLVPAPASGDAAASKYLGADGTWSTPAGAGNVTGQASSVDAEIALFSGTGGKTIKRAAGTGPVYATAGVISYGPATVTKTATYSIVAGDDVVSVSGASFTLTLPAASAAKQVIIKRTDSDLTRVYTVSRAGSDTFDDGTTSTTLNTQGETIVLVSDGTATWNLVSRDYPRTWATYTPTFTGFGTVSSQLFRWRRIGDSVQIRGEWATGTTSPVEARLTLPTGMTADSNYSTVEAVGTIDPGVASTTELSALMEPSKTYMTFGAHDVSTSGLTKANGNAAFASSTSYGLKPTTIAISGWK